MKKRQPKNSAHRREQFRRSKAALRARLQESGGMLVHCEIGPQAAQALKTRAEKCGGIKAAIEEALIGTEPRKVNPIVEQQRLAASQDHGNPKEWHWENPACV